MIKDLLGELYTPEIAAKLDGKQIAVVNDGSYIPRAKLKEAADEAKELKRQLQERDTQLETLKTKAAGNEDLLKQINDLKTANQQVQTEWETKLAAQTKGHAIDRAIAEAKGKNPKAIKALLDLDKVSLDGENIIGLKEQLEALQTNDAYLFDDGKPGPVGVGTNPPGGGNKPPDVQEEYEQAMKQGNLALAISLKNKLFSKL